MRQGIVIAGVALLILGVVLFGVGMLEATQAAAAYVTCFMGGSLICTDLLGTMAFWGMIENVGIAVGVIGLIVLLVGAVLQEEGPRPTQPYPQYPPPAYPPSYAPPAYPPPVYPPAQEPKTPPPGTK